MGGGVDINFSCQRLNCSCNHGDIQCYSYSLRLQFELFSNWSQFVLNLLQFLLMINWEVSCPAVVLRFSVSLSFSIEIG